MMGGLTSFDIFSGSETGYLKGCNFSKKNSVSVNRVDAPKKSIGISGLAWGNLEQTKIISGCKYGQVYCYCLTSNSCNQLHDDQMSVEEEQKKLILKGLKYSEKDSNLILAFNNGHIKCTHFEDTMTCDVDDKSCHEFNAGNDLYCLDQNLDKTELIATGGKDNLVKIWNITKPEQKPIFTAKNVRCDWLDLVVPIWNTKVEFVRGGDKIVAITGHSQIRMYDPSTPQRRPVIDMSFGENPLTAMALRPGMENHVVVGNAIGSIALLDLRKKGIVKSFKGARGGVTDIKFHPSQPVFATCGVDRFVNCYELETLKAPIYSMYMNSSQNCVLFSSNWSPADISEDKNEVRKRAVKGSDPSQEDSVDYRNKNEEEDIWGSMDVVKTKKRKVAVDSKPKKRKKVEK